MNTSIRNLQIEDTVKYEYYGETFEGGVKEVRQCYTSYKTWFVFTTCGHCVSVDINGQPVDYNGYSCKIIEITK